MKRKNKTTTYVYLVDGNNTCFSSEASIIVYFNRLWKVHESMIHTGNILEATERTSTKDLSFYEYNCAGKSSYFTRRILVDTNEVLDRCFEEEYIGFHCGVYNLSPEGVIKHAGHDYKYEFSHYALTLTPEELGKNLDGWTITGDVREDYYQWVNDFEAEHPHYGKISGNFETEVKAESQEAFDHFWEHHQPQAWDYWDI